MVQAAIHELTGYILDKFRAPNGDWRYLGGPSNYVETFRDVRRTLNSLNQEKDSAIKLELLTVLEGQIMILEALSYYSETEMKTIIDMIESIKEGEK